MDRTRAEELRARAEEVRMQAEEATSGSVRDALLELARDYDQLAELAEESDV